MRHLIEKRIADAEQELEDARCQLRLYEARCQHSWGNTKSDHIHTEAYTIPGDTPGTMGVDYRGPLHVPAKTESQWKRTCKACGRVERTNRTTERIHSNMDRTRTPQF